MPKNKDQIHGNIYQLKLLMLFLHRGIRHKYDFILRTEMDEADHFEDLIFRYEQDNKTFFRLLQAKHSLDESKKITAANLFAGTKKEHKYSLMKYYNSYMNCKNKDLFKEGSFKDLIICTNVDFDFADLNRNGIKVYPITEEDNILCINIHEGKKVPMRYKFDTKFADFLKQKMEEYDDLLVVKDLVDFILNHKTFHKQCFKTHANALVSEVIDKKGKKLHENFVSNTNLSPRTSRFRDKFEHEIKKETNNELDLKMLNEAIEQKIRFNNTVVELCIPEAFGKNSNKRNNQWPSISTKDVKDFLNLLTFAVNQINEDELGKAIKSEIGDHFNKITTESIYNGMFQHMVDFLQDKHQSGDAEMGFWTFEKGKTFIKNTCFEIIRLQLSGFRDHLDSIKFKFKENLSELTRSFINSNEILWLLTSETPWLNTTVVYQSIKDIFNESTGNKKKKKKKLFIYKWNDLLDNNGEILSDFKNYDDFLIIITCLQMIGSECITAEFVEKIKQIFFEQQSDFKKIIVVASEGHEFRRQLLSQFQDCYREELHADFSDMDDESQKILLEKENINFQGNRHLSIRKLLNIDDSECLSPEQIQMLNLDASATELLLRNSEVKIFDQTNDFNSIPYNPNKAVSFDNIIKEIASNRWDIFAFYGDDQEIITLFHNKQIDLVRFSVRHSLNFIMMHRLLLLDLEKEATEFNILCKILFDYMVDTSAYYKPALHKLKYMGNNKWIWMQTFDCNLYINRHYNPNVISSSVLKSLAETRFPDFILFSGLQKKEVFGEIQKYYEGKNIQLNHSIFEKNCYIARSVQNAKIKFNYYSKIIEENPSYNPNDTYSIAKILHNKKAIHWIKLEKVADYRNLRLKWQQSAGNINAIYYRRDLDEYLPEDSLIHVNQRLILLAGAAGMGKSSTLTQIIQNLKKQKPTSLIIEINLNKFQQYLFPVNSEIQFMSLLFYVLKKSSAHAIETKILKYKMEHFGQLVLLFDGFDDISEERKESVLNLFKFIIQKTKANLWITSRPENQKKLETSLCVLSYSLDVPRNAAKIEYLSYFWRMHFKFSGEKPQDFDFRKFAQIVCKDFYDEHRDFIEIPLMLRLVAEKYMGVFTNVMLINDNENDKIIEEKIRKINLTDIIESFIHHAYEVYFFEKMKIPDWFDNDSQAILRDGYSRACKRLAIKHLCGFYRDPRLYLGDKPVKLPLFALSRIGLIQVYNSPYASEHQNVMGKFIHRSILEFFATEFVCNSLKIQSTSEIFWEFLINVILRSSYCRRIFEDKLIKDKELSSLSSEKRQKEILFRLLLQQVKKYDSAVALWKAAVDGSEHTVRFLTKCFFFPERYDIAQKILEISCIHFLSSFVSEKELIDYIMDKGSIKKMFKESILALKQIVNGTKKVKTLIINGNLMH